MATVAVVKGISHHQLNPGKAIPVPARRQHLHLCSGRAQKFEISSLRTLSPTLTQFQLVQTALCNEEAERRERRINLSCKSWNHRNSTNSSFNDGKWASSSGIALRPFHFREPKLHKLPLRSPTLAGGGTNGHTSSFSSIGRDGGLAEPISLRTDAEVETELFKFMQESEQPDTFPSRQDLIRAGREDLVEACLRVGGWLTAGWDMEENREDVNARQGGTGMDERQDSMTVPESNSLYTQSSKDVQTEPPHSASTYSSSYSRANASSEETTQSSSALSAIKDWELAALLSGTEGRVEMDSSAQAAEDRAEGVDREGGGIEARAGEKLVEGNGAVRSSLTEETSGAEREQEELEEEKQGGGKEQTVVPREWERDVEDVVLGAQSRLSSLFEELGLPALEWRKPEEMGRERERERDREVTSRGSVSESGESASLRDSKEEREGGETRNFGSRYKSEEARNWKRRRMQEERQQQQQQQQKSKEKKDDKRDVGSKLSSR